MLEGELQAAQGPALTPAHAYTVPATSPLASTDHMTSEPRIRVRGTWSHLWEVGLGETQAGPRTEQPPGAGSWYAKSGMKGGAG